MNEISHSEPLNGDSMKTAVRYGLMNGGVAIVWSLFMYVTGLNRTSAGQSINYIGMVIPLVFIYYAIKDFRLHQGHGFINFNQAFKQGFQVALIGGVIGTLFMILYMNVIDPTYMDYLKHLQQVKMEDMGMAQEEIDKAMARGASWQTPPMFLMWGIIGSLLISAIFGLIMAAILKKPNPEEIV